MPVIGIDVGGANLKVADDQGHAESRCFALWQHPDRLADVLQDLLISFIRKDNVVADHDTPTDFAVVMTGELADCFIDRQQGVLHIIDHVHRATKAYGGLLRFYGVDGQFHSALHGRELIDTLAASNWHALANFVSRAICPDAILVDVGSTTTDIIPIANGQIATSAKTDYDRLCQGTLIYVGCQRTSVCALCETLDFRGIATPVMKEFFATIDDALVVLGLEPEQPGDRQTADGQPRTRLFAANRLARMLGLDRRSVAPLQAEELAEQVLLSARQRLDSAFHALLRTHASPTTSIVLSGHGIYLLNLPPDRTLIRLSDTLGPQVSRAAPAYAAAQLLKHADSQ